jgi:hypothetical protein
MTDARRFLGPVIVEVGRGLFKDRPFTVRQAFSFISDEVGEIVVPAGFDTDFASVPVAFRRLFPVAGPYRRAAIVHDYLCVVKPPMCDYRAAARVFREAMEDDDVPGWMVFACYQAVLHFGPRFGFAGQKM